MAVRSPYFPVISKMSIQISFQIGRHSRAAYEIQFLYGDEIQDHGSRLATELGEVVFVSSADLFDHPMCSQAVEQAGDLAGGLVGEVSAGTSTSPA